MTSRRSYGSYDDGCAAAHALDLVGERWALLVVRELILGPKRFTDLRKGVPGASPNVLAQRLRELEDVGVVQRRTLGPPSGARVYELTEWGLELESVLQTLGRWGSRSPAMPHGARVGVDTMRLALRTRFDPTAAAYEHITLDLRLGSDRFRAGVTDGELELERGGVRRPDAIVTTDANTLDAVAFYGGRLDDALDAGDLQIDGDRGVVERFLALFPSLVPVSPEGTGQ
jgi:DNA-binding HxlR family transcriptional regulator